MSAPAVDIQHVSKEIAGRAIVDDVSLSVAQGEFFSVIGPSGCGKTTTLRLVAGLDAVSSGSIAIGGGDVTRVPVNRRPTNMVFQRLGLFPHLDVHDNIAFGLRLRRVPEAEVTARVRHMLDMVQLPDAGRRAVTTLSGGQQQRVALARALANRPSVLLLDEPLSALDLALQIHLQGELKRIQRQVGTTFIYVTHNQAEAMAMSDRMAVMRDGRLEQVGTPSSLYQRPSSRFVAEFMGASNLLAGRVGERTGGSIRIDAAGLGIVAETSQGWSPGQPVVLSLRPERIAVARNIAAGANRFVLPVSDTSFEGATVHYVLELPGGASLHARVADDGTPPLDPGQSVEVGFAADAAVVFAQ